MRSFKSEVIVMALSLIASSANAAELKVVASVGVRAVLSNLGPDFERVSGHKVEFSYGTAVPLKRQIDGGEAFDVAILVPAMLEDLSRMGKVLAGKRHKHCSGRGRSCGEARGTKARRQFTSCT